MASDKYDQGLSVRSLGAQGGAETTAWAWAGSQGSWVEWRSCGRTLEKFPGVASGNIPAPGNAVCRGVEGGGVGGQLASYSSPKDTAVWPQAGRH